MARPATCATRPEGKTGGIRRSTEEDEQWTDELALRIGWPQFRVVVQEIWLKTTQWAQWGGYEVMVGGWLEGECLPNRSGPAQWKEITAEQILVLTV